MVSVGTRYRFLIGIIFIGLLGSCGSSADQRGEIIPPKSVYKLPQRPEIVVSYMTQLLRDNDGAQLYYLRAKAYFQLRDYVQAEPDIQRALEKNPSDEDYLLLSAQIKSQLGWYSQALEEAKALESSGYSSSPMYLVLSEIYLASHSKRLSAGYLQKAQSLGIPTADRDYAIYLGKMSRGDSLQAMQGITSKEIDHRTLCQLFFTYQLPRMSQLAYQKLILSELKKYPYDPYLLKNWGRFLVQLHQYNRAEQVYKKVLVQLPANPSFLLEFAEFYVRLGNYDQALLYLAQVPKQASVYRDVLFNQAIVYLKTGQKSRSMAILDSARMQFKSDRRFIELRDRLLGRRMDSSRILVDSTVQKSE
jgi:tetratricopeptide (TPR) repeat protein